MPASEKSKPPVSEAEAQRIRDATRSMISKLAHEKEFDIRRNSEPVLMENPTDDAPEPEWDASDWTEVDRYGQDLDEEESRW